MPDARWALDRIVERFADLPVGLVGRSMGGRQLRTLLAPTSGTAC
jgi:predicted alpha/beta-fold hydrolase